MPIGPTFASELIAAAIPTDGISWDTISGVVSYRDDISQATRNAVAAVLAAHNPAATTPQSVLEAAALDWLNGGAGNIDIRKIFKAKVISDLAFRLGKAPGALTANELNAERARLAAIYKAL